jgi:hypothetical protein
MFVIIIKKKETPFKPEYFSDMLVFNSALEDEEDFDKIANSIRNYAPLHGMDINRDFTHMVDCWVSPSSEETALAEIVYDLFIDTKHLKDFPFEWQRLVADSISKTFKSMREALPQVYRRLRKSPWDERLKELHGMKENSSYKDLPDVPTSYEYTIMRDLIGAFDDNWDTRSLLIALTRVQETLLKTIKLP